jgi:RNA polymerase sigma-70 factor, ECF subfamily
MVSGMQEAGKDLRDAFSKAYDEFLEPIYRYFYYRFNDRDQAKDLAQETFMRAWTYARTGKEIGAMKPFLYTTASNIFKNELRGRKAVTSLDMLTTETGFEIESEETSAEEISEARMLMQKLDQLSPSYREVLTLRYVDGLPPKEIASILGESDSNVSVRIHRALRKLREIHEGKI